jgi:type II restriction/modification system DNA methylase subunit YeeA
MDTSKLKKFAQYARRSLIEQVGSKLNQILSDESPAEREHPEAVAKLKQKIAASDETQVIEQVAYTWFNRFCALRFMDVNEYSRIMVVSPLAGQFQPEILAEAKAGHIDDTVVSDKTREKIVKLLNGTEASRDGQTEAYRLLIVAVCNDYHRIMPYLFERIEDYTELLMPDDLLSGNSILAYTREAMTPDACESVEAIGWLYQFYISEKKDDVFADLKKNVKITPENIPAATQLFTPHWIVRYLVENSLGRLWMLNNPDSKVIEQMEYYIKPADENDVTGSHAPAWEPISKPNDNSVCIPTQERGNEDFLKISSPEELKICDPACGSGHMLTYAYDLLYAIYLDDGRVDPADIPEKILTNNLYGIEIDERASELAAFALTMKAVKGNPLDEGNNRRRFFRNPVKPNICRLEKVQFSVDELDIYIDFVGEGLFTQDLRATLKEFEEADNFGSLIQPTLKSPSDALIVLEAKDVSGQLFLAETHKSVLMVLQQADYLSPKYHVVIANPPYMGSSNFNNRLKVWLSASYKVTRSDLYAIFMERSIELLKLGGDLAMVTMQGWMFTRSYEELRESILRKCQISTLAQLGTNAFNEISGEIVQACAFVFKSGGQTGCKSSFVRLVDGDSKQKEEMLLRGEGRFEFLQSDFSRIPGSIMVYWAGDTVVKIFDSLPPASNFGDFREGIHTGDNNRFMRYWWEVSNSKFSYSEVDEESVDNNNVKWIPYNKGGSPVRWYGGNEWVLAFDDFSRNEMGKLSGHVRPSQGLYFKEGATWPDISSGKFGIRYFPDGFLFADKGPVYVGNHLSRMIAVLNSRTFTFLASLLMPTLAFKCGTVRNIPVPNLDRVRELEAGANKLVELSKQHWDENEVSWDFIGNPLLTNGFECKRICDVYNEYEGFVTQRFEYMAGLETINNKLASEAYKLVGMTESEVKPSELTIDDVEYSATIKEFISYAVSCMFGRYSLDKKGLILASQGDTLEGYLKQIPIPSFKPDDDNVIPLIDLELEKGKQEDWFEDDISERFKAFLKVTFGTENYDENLRFIEAAIGKDIKKFFLKDFYTDHIKRYKKRPIYWLFSSPKGSFNALIYMHRYRSDTVSVVLNDYLREFRTKLDAKKESYEQTSISANAEAADKTKALKAIEKIKTVLEEVKGYERDILYPLAGQNIEIDLDDGVKHNYPLFGRALKKVTGLS